MKDLLEESKYLLREGKHVGNTTRQVDVAIDLLHQGHEVLIEDHSQTTDGKLTILYMVNKRLEFMYNHLFGVTIKLNSKRKNENIIIKLITPKNTKENE